MKTKKIILPESQMPTQWYNIVSDMKNRPLPPLNPATKEPVTLEQMRDRKSTRLNSSHANESRMPSSA